MIEPREPNASFTPAMPSVQPENVTVVQVTAIWRGVRHGHRHELPAEATHAQVDRAVFGSQAKVRQALAKAEYPDIEFSRPTEAPIRDDSTLWAAVTAYLMQTLTARFELVPPEPLFGSHQWRAYFKHSSRVGSEPYGVEMNPPVGLGSSCAMAVENLLRFVEGRDTIDG